MILFYSRSSHGRFKASERNLFSALGGYTLVWNGVLSFQMHSSFDFYACFLFCFVWLCFFFHFDSLFTWAHVQAASYAISGTETLVPEEGVKGILFQESSLGRWGVKWLNYGTGFLAWPTCWPYTLLPG